MTPVAVPRVRQRKNAYTLFALIAVGFLGVLGLLGGVYSIVTDKGSKGPDPKTVSEDKKAPPVVEEKKAPPVVEDKNVDPDRRAAEYALSIGSLVCVNEEVAERTLANLPREAFRLTSFDGGYQNAKLTDAGLANSKDSQTLRTVSPCETEHVHDDSLAHFKGCKNLKILSLANIRGDGEGSLRIKNRRINRPIAGLM